jgi:DNA-binding GntR family transcriptional regulator
MDTRSGQESQGEAGLIGLGHSPNFAAEKLSAAHLVDTPCIHVMVRGRQGPFGRGREILVQPVTLSRMATHARSGKGSSQHNDMGAVLPTLDRVSTRLQVVDILRNAIITGALRPGQKVPEEEIARSLGTSRTPVREAIRLLEIQGLLHVQPKIGTFIASPEIGEVRDALDVRIALESLAAEECVKRLAPEDWSALIKDLNRIASDMTDATDPVRAVELDISFHAALVSATKNDYLRRTWDLVGMPFLIWAPERKLYTGRPYPDNATLSSRHHELATALSKRDPVTASAAIRQHCEEKLLDIELAETPSAMPGGST